jgi:hypothetical protein
LDHIHNMRELALRFDTARSPAVSVVAPIAEALPVALTLEIFAVGSNERSLTSGNGNSGLFPAPI